MFVASSCTNARLVADGYLEGNQVIVSLHVELHNLQVE